jgi:hypothetical protein
VRIAAIIAFLLSPGLALAGWRLGLRGRGGVGDNPWPLDTRSALPLRRRDSVRPRVKKANYQ